MASYTYQNGKSGSFADQLLTQHFTGQQFRCVPLPQVSLAVKREKRCPKIMRRITCLLVALSISGCATINTLQPGAGGSTFEVRGKSYDNIWKAVVTTASRSLTVVESNKGSGILRAEKGAGIATWGEVVGIFIRPTSNGASVYTVEVQSLKRSRLQITGQDWTATMIAGIKAELDQ